MRCTSGGSETQGWPTLIAGDGSTHHPRPDGHLELRDVDVEVLREQLLQDSVQEALEHLAPATSYCKNERGLGLSQSPLYRLLAGVGRLPTLFCGHRNDSGRLAPLRSPSCSSWTLRCLHATFQGLSDEAHRISLLHRECNALLLQADHLAAGTNDVVLFKEHVQLWGEVTEGSPQVDWFPFQTIHTRAGVPREANWQPVRMHFIYKGGKAEPVAWEVTAIALSVANFELPFPQESRLRIDFSGEEAQAQAFQWICRYVFSYHIPVDSTLPFWYEEGGWSPGRRMRSCMSTWRSFRRSPMTRRPSTARTGRVARRRSTMTSNRTASRTASTASRCPGAHAVRSGPKWPKRGLYGAPRHDDRRLRLGTCGTT